MHRHPVFTVNQPGGFNTGLREDFFSAELNR